MSLLSISQPRFDKSKPEIINCKIKTYSIWIKFRKQDMITIPVYNLNNSKANLCTINPFVTIIKSHLLEIYIALDPGQFTHVKNIVLTGFNRSSWLVLKNTKENNYTSIQWYKHRSNKKVLVVLKRVAHAKKPKFMNILDLNLWLVMSFNFLTRKVLQARNKEKSKISKTQKIKSPTTMNFL